MTEKQFKAWLKVKLGNLAGVCDAGYQKPERLLSRLSDIFSEAEKRALTVTRKDKPVRNRLRGADEPTN